jgi:L-lactate dehydrogenase complex protein LldG
MRPPGHPKGEYRSAQHEGTAMSSGRERVLANIRRALGRDGPELAAIPPLPGVGPRPAFEGDLIERFAAKMIEKSATLERIASLADVGDAAARFVTSHGAAQRLCISPALNDIAWPPGFTIHAGAAGRDEQTSVTPCFAAVAEAGAVITLSGPNTPSTLNFVPENHIVIVHAGQVVRHFEDAWAQWRASGLTIVRTLNVISGPSRTADIEQTIQLGAHGPRRLHILLVSA